MIRLTVWSLSTDGARDALIQSLEILVRDNVRSRFFKNHEEVVILVLVSVPRDVPFDAKGARRCLTSDLVINALGRVLVDEKIAPEGEKSIGREASAMGRKRLVSIGRIT